jgi:hypothetical protein
MRKCGYCGKETDNKMFCDFRCWAKHYGYRKGS